jgi:hypothetical protein
LNIFHLASCPKKAAQMQCDTHVCKMILESAQLLSTAHRELDGDGWADSNLLYKSTHKNHPSAVWIRESSQHYLWGYEHMMHLGEEYRYRYGKTHKTIEKLGRVLKRWPDSIRSHAFVQPPQCMPDEYKSDDSVVAYQRYYALDKARNSWFKYEKGRPAPTFIKEIQNGCPA